METIVKSFDELSLDELYEILKLRVDVFVVEQACPYPEVDGNDQNAYHVFLRDEDGIQAYLRVLDRGVTMDEVAIGRVIAKRRREGLGTQVMKAGIGAAQDKFNASTIQLEAQVYAQKLYESLGFKVTSDEFLEDGIPHVQMTLHL